MEKFIRLDAENIANEHICCAFSDKKCNNGKFVTTDLSVCMDSRFDKVMGSINLPG